MAFNGHQRDDETTDEDETPTKQPRSGYFRNEPNNEAAAAATRATSDRRTSNSTARHRSDSVKKTRPRRCFPVAAIALFFFVVFF